ncbi:LOW QUALITY PROTEIN: chondroitin sulfate proteoglycan 4-like [Centruroides vittatus]|uniref:LOW QUALITY PROTEIN: chondroitin sulfate proteoglycan 4-like n=1 Tax=Centruroides vittatus TaxID=120091 RepID=UPI00351053C7
MFVFGFSPLLLALAWTVGPSHPASFYGVSHLSVPLQDSKSKTDVYFRFLTHRADCLLFLAAGSIDYCLVVLEAGEIKVRINLGAGEAVLNSPHGLKLNDLLWHEVEIHRTDAELTLNIDNIHSTYLDIPGRFFELNIKFGIFVGGLGGFDELFLGNLHNFRGCLDELTFNDNDILKLASESSDKRNIFGVTWDCSDQFEASSHQPISFVQRGSYVTFPGWNSRSGGSVSFNIKTQSSMAVLFYNSGIPAKPDFFSLEIINGKLVFSVNEGNGVLVLQSEVVVSDGIWHGVDLQFSPTYVEIAVDGQAKNLRPGLGENRYFDLAGYLYVGGIEVNKQSRALQQGLQSVLAVGVDSSLRGCIKNLKISNQLMGFREVIGTHGVQTDCVWEYPCLQDPCVPHAECFQEGTDSFRCMCDGSVCVRANFSSTYKLYTKSSLPIDLEILTLQPLEISEGGSDLITSEHIRVVLDYQKFGVRDSEVLFHILEPPRHGTLEIEIWRRSADSIFTLLDLNTDKIRYTHQGSEDHRDSITFELEFRERNHRLPVYLEQRHRFLFHIHISPVNDPPRLKLPPNRVMRLAKNTKKNLGQDILDADDPDTGPGDLVYTVLNLGSDNEGFIENAKNPGQPIETFTQEEINNGVISYVHRGVANSRIALRVSDGIEAGQTGILRVVTFDLALSLVNNTGLLLPYDSSALILSDNLTFTTNSPDQTLEIRYDITRLPQYGIIQRLRGNERWQPVNHFTQRQVKKEKIRYIHQSGRPSYDDFKFVVSCADLKVANVYDFRITFIAVNLRRIVDKELILERVLEGHLSDSEVKFETNPISTPADQIVYTVLNPPIYGNLVLFQSSNLEHRHKKLDVGTTFTQQDIDSKHVKYKLHRRSYSAVSDRFDYRVNCPGGAASDILTFHIRHVPGETDVTIVNEKLTVLEGDRAVITKSHLHIETPKYTDIIYNITSYPKHGILGILDPTHTSTEEHPPFFTTDQIAARRVVYAHDDSEHDTDRIQFVAHEESATDGFVYYGVLHINVIMKNDNSPTRAVKKPFHVVINGKKRLTGRDVRYVDMDIDSKTSDIQYTRREIPNGGLYHVDNPDTQVYQFSQEDLDKGKIVFKHNGANYGKAALWVTDGQFYATGVLEIEASEPFLRVSGNTGLVVRRGENAPLTSANLTVETNLDTEPAEIIYKVVSVPKHGDLLIGGKQITQFTQKELDEAAVKYENDNSDVFFDSFHFSVQMDDIQVKDTFPIKIYPDIYWKPLQVISNKTLYVDEGKSVVIDPSSLKVAHVNINPSNITYLVTEPPRHGFLRLGSAEREADEDPLLKTFNQAAVNDGKLVYVQTEKNVSTDFFSFTVTNGITALKDLKFSFNVVSKVILIKTGNISVLEGQEGKITADDITVANAYYAQRVTEYLVVEQPQHGYIRNVKLPDVKLEGFQTSQLSLGLIRYVHDGSETSRDWFTLVAHAPSLKKESAPSTIHVTVELVNDEAPHVVNNTGLEVWEGAVTVISNRHLAAADDDSEAEDLHFVISTPSNGYVALKNDTRTPVLSFTQDQINKGMVVFVHTGEKAGGFRLEVNDGLISGSSSVFTITAKSLRMVMEVNEKLNVLPRMQQSITKDHLLVTTNDQDSGREIVYRVIREPSLGRILLENPDGSLSLATQFTQNQINKNLVLYEQTESITGLTAVDEIGFDVETQHAETLRGVNFQIEISVGNFGSGNFDQMVELHPLTVKEGGKTAISQEHVDLSRLSGLWQGKGKSEFAKKLKITVWDQPLHGWLEVDGENSTYSKVSFTREDMRKKRVFYVHDDSDTFSDSVSLAFYLNGDDTVQDILLFNKTLNVTVRPVNDGIFQLLTKVPRLDVVQGQRAALTGHNLNTTDPDNVPSDIVYEIISKPSNGILVYGVNGSNPIYNFTQEDVDRSRVYFVQDGTNDTGSFHFKVSDGKHKAVYTAFNIYVEPLSLELVNCSRIEVLQGSTEVFVRRQNLGAVTNGNREDIWYNVTREPEFGRIFLGDDIVTQFRQVDVDAETVQYMQLDLTVSFDRFAVSVSNRENVIADRTVDVTVVPLVKQRPFNATSGTATALTLEALDASKLARKTKSDPVYTVTRGPKYGVLQLKGGRKERETSEQFRFTHGDVAEGKLTYNSGHVDFRGSVSDSFEYLLTAPNVQPAKGKFVIVLRPGMGTAASEAPAGKSPPDHDTVSVSTTPSARDYTTEKTAIEGVAEEPPPAAAPGDGFVLSGDHLLTVGVAVGVAVLLSVLVVAVKCQKTRKRKKKRERKRQDGKVPGSHTAQTELDASDHLPSNGSLSLSDDLPPPAPPTSPSSTGSRSGSATPRQRTSGSRCKSGEGTLPPPPPPPYLTEGLGDWTEVSPTVPTCKVTPLSHRERSELGETALKSPLAEMADREEWNHYDPGDIRYGPPGNLMLRKNQYWV